MSFGIKHNTSFVLGVSARIEQIAIVIIDSERLCRCLIGLSQVYDSRLVNKSVETNPETLSFDGITFYFNRIVFTNNLIEPLFNFVLILLCHQIVPEEV